MALTDIALDAAQEGWRARAACRDADINIFFPTTDEEAGPAKAICATCPVRVECLEFALATRQEDGVWGGLTETERRRLRRRLRERARNAA
jgi:WhiB family redox-sensing transcriptional regulator